MSVRALQIPTAVSLCMLVQQALGIYLRLEIAVL